MDEVADSRRPIVAGKTLTSGRDDLGQPIGKQVMLVRALFGDHGFDEYAEPLTVAASLRLHEVKEQVCACHSYLPSLDR